jgi:hypothetical protein
VKTSVPVAAVLCAILSASRAHVADAQTFVPCRPGATVRYVNGIKALSRDEIADEASLLADEIAHFSVTCVANVSYLYNPSDRIHRDLFESALQMVSELRIALGEAILNVGFAMSGIPTLLLTAAQRDEIRDRVIAAMQEVSLSSYSFTIDGRNYTTAGLVNEFRDRVIIDLTQGTKVVLVAHSQGNFFANATQLAVNGKAPLELQRGLAIVNVANVSSFAPSNLYISAHQDKVVTHVRWLSAMPTNHDATGACDVDPDWCHAFAKVYLSRVLPTGVTREADSMAGGLMSRLQTALNVTPSPAGSIVGSTFTSLVRIDLETLTAQTLGSFSSTSGGLTPVYDIAINPRDGLAAAISPSALSTFDPGIRVLTRMPQSGIGGNALTFNVDGELFAMSGSSFYKISPQTGAIDGNPLSLGASYSTSGDLTFDSDGNLFGTAIGPSGRDYLITIDTLRRSVTPIGDTGYYQVWGLYFSGGVLYGATNNGALISIDRSTGQGTLVATLNIGTISGLQ